MKYTKMFLVGDIGIACKSVLGIQLLGDLVNAQAWLGDADRRLFLLLVLTHKLQHLFKAHYFFGLLKKSHPPDLCNLTIFSG